MKLRWLGIPLVVVLASIVFVEGVAHAGIGAGASPTFPASVMVGQTNIPASITLFNFNTPPNQLDVNTVCNFGDALPCPVLETGITLIPSCGGQDLFSICTAPDPGVFAVSATGRGVALTACDGMMFNITTTALGRLRFTPQAPGQHVQLPGTLASCEIAFTFDVVKAPTVDADPLTPGLQTLQIVDNTQHSGTTASARGSGRPVTVALAQPTIATTASGPIGLGGQLLDNATVSGRINPQAGATIDFRLYGPNDATCANPPVFTSTVPYPVAGGPVASAAFTPASPGLYRWRAFYSGDANNSAIAGPCNAANENTPVSPGTPTIATTASGPIALGGQLLDNATVSGRVNPLPGATIDFRLYGPDDPTCANPPVFQSLAVPYPVAGGPVASAPFTPTVAGTYRWRAFYSGDANNSAVAGPCNAPSENTTVSPATPTIATTASGPIGLGGQLLDNATVSGRVNPLPGATIDFRLYGPDDATCANPPVFESLGVPYPVAGGPVASAAFTPTTPGTYRWRAFYSGDANNTAVAGPCNAPDENTPVTPPPVQFTVLSIATTASGTITVGAGQLLDIAVVSGRVNPLAATIEFRLYGPDDTACANPPVFVSTVDYPVAGGPVSSGPFTPTAAGVYRWRALYSGDANNAAIAGDCNAPNESVVVSPPPLVLPPAILPETL